MAYQSLYRKYRPQRFTELVGQEHVTTALRNAVRDERVGHAYLFSGPRGTGKTTTARILAKALNCLDLGADGEPCGVCDHCTAIANGTFLDLFELDAASNRGIDDARELTQSIALLSALGGKKLYILDEVHMLTPQASNALLKTLEEPPEHVVFVLATTNPEQVLPTIRSRTQHYEFSLLSTEQLVAHLADVCTREGVDADPDALALVARAGAGSARDALSLLDQALAHSTGRLVAAEVVAVFGASPFELRATILRGVADGDPATVLIELGALLDSGHEPRRVADDLLRTARDAFLLHASAGRVQVDGSDDELAALRAIGDGLGNVLLVRVVETLGQAIVDMRGVDAADPRLVLEVALVRLARRDAGPPLALLAERVERLERAAATDGQPAAPVEPTAPAPDAGSATGSATGTVPKRALGAVRGERASTSTAEPTPTAEPAAAEEPEEPGSESEPESESPPAPSVPFDLDEIILAWAEMVDQFSPPTKASVKHAQPIAVDGDVVVFGVAPQMHNKVMVDRFKNAADAIRPEFARRFGRTPRFRFVPSEAADLEGLSSGSDAGAAEPLIDDVPPEVDVDVDALHDLEGAEPAGPAVSSVGMLEAEFGATVVEERPR